MPCPDWVCGKSRCSPFRCRNKFYPGGRRQCRSPSSCSRWKYGLLHTVSVACSGVCPIRQTSMWSFSEPRPAFSFHLIAITSVSRYSMALFDSFFFLARDSSIRFYFRLVCSQEYLTD